MATNPPDNVFIVSVKAPPNSEVNVRSIIENLIHFWSRAPRPPP